MKIFSYLYSSPVFNNGIFFALVWLCEVLCAVIFSEVSITDSYALDHCS